ncbi:MAG: ferric reductase-like transmembrane domain-containing protein [Burkholderiales bacterium]|nr:ferric reductase-like transmembrane domain-containing protein [Burkholderiales bacterium]
MRNLKRTFWGALLVLVILWLLAEPTVFQSSTFFGLRDHMVQVSGVLAMGCMSLAMALALRPLWPQARLGGLDKMYRLHKWLGIAALVVAIVHWLWAKGPKWAVGWGWLTPPARGSRPVLDHPIQAWLMAVLLARGSWAARVVLVRKVGARRQVKARSQSLNRFAGVKALKNDLAAHGFPVEQHFHQELFSMR